MTMRFKLTPHVKAILKGRGMCKDDRLLCASETCLFHPSGTSDTNYGKDIEIIFRQKIRDEKKFKSPEALKKQIQLDILQAALSK